jgi:hypothetical protein
MYRKHREGNRKIIFSPWEERIERKGSVNWLGEIMNREEERQFLLLIIIMKKKRENRKVSNIQMEARHWQWRVSSKPRASEMERRCTFVYIRSKRATGSGAFQTARILLRTVRMDSDMSRLLLRVDFFTNCVNPNWSVPRQHTSTLTYWFVCVVDGQIRFLNSHRPKLSHIGLDPLNSLDLSEV